MEKRTQYSAEYKREAVELSKREDMSVSQAAHDLGISRTMLTRWRREHEHDGSEAFQGQGHARDDEVAQLRRELAQVKKERDFLKDAAAFFAKDSK